MPTRRASVGFLPRWDLGEHTVRNRQGPEFLLSPVAIGISIADRTGPPPPLGGGPVTDRYGSTRLMRVAQWAGEVRVLPRAPIGAARPCGSVQVCAMYAEAIHMLLPSTA